MAAPCERPYLRRMATNRLTPLDATFLELEQCDPSAHMHIGAAMVFEGDPPSLEEVARHLEQRLGVLPLYRRRLSELATHGLEWPEWVETPGFDVRHHLRRAALPAPGREAELHEWLADYWSHRLDRSRPLWDAALLEGLAGGRWALVTKTHHCMVDGVGSVDVGHLLLDPEPDGSSWTAPDEEPLPTADHHRMRSLARVLDPRRTREYFERSKAMAELLVRDELSAAPRTSLNRRIGERRRIGVARFELDAIRALKRELGGTVNDVALAIVTGGLRRLLLERGEAPPAQGLRAMVPVNRRGGDDHFQLGNKITSLFVHLPVAEPDPAERYARTMGEAEGLKAGNQAIGGSTLVEIAGLAPPVFHAVLARSLFATRLFNVTVTNVPGPRQCLYAFRQPMVDVVGLVPIAAEHALGVCIVSYDGRMTFTVNADYDSVPDLDVLTAGMETTFAELNERAALAAA